MTLQLDTVTTDANGESTHSWADIDDVYARITPMSAFERSIAAQNSQRVSHEIVIWYRSDLGTSDIGLSPAHRLTYDGRTFEIRGFIDPDESKTYYVLTCEETRN